jgi:curved DNA-binding protein CbpA
MRVSVQMKRLLLEGARRLPPDFTAARISDLNEKLSPPMSAPEANLELLPKEAFVLSRLDAPLTVAELLSISTLSEEETRHIVYTLALGGLVTRERPSRAFSAQMLERARSVKAPSQSATPAPKQEQAPARSKSAPADVAAPAGVKAEAVEEFGLDAFFARLERATTHYEALGVRRSAPPAEIKSSYHKLAKSFHPDRFHKDADAALRARIEAAFARVAQAYETLKEKQSRATYDLKLSQTSASVQPQQQQSASAPFGQTQTQASGSVPRQPEATEAEGAAAARSRTAAESFGRGLLALRQSKPTAAIVSFAEAARLVPTDARYRAYYGRALAENESTRRQAENELKVAIALDGSNAGYRVMLAEVYALIGLPRRAQSELERALALDSKNTAARELLNTLQAAKG